MGRAGRLRRLSIGSVVLAAAAAAMWAAASPASAQPEHQRPPVVLAALGDSYSSGVGTPDPDPSIPACYRTPHAWPSLVGDALGWQVHNLACSGAKTADITAPYGGQEAQTALLAALRPRPEVVTITIGGNDVGFAPVLGACFGGDCLSQITASEKAMVNTLPGLLAQTYRAVEAADPRARLVVVGYPRLFPSDPAAVTGCSWLSDAERASLVRAGNLLNGVIAVEARLAGATYVDVSSTLRGHELCTADSWLVPLPEQMGAHPTVPGQQAIADAVAARLSHLRLTPSHPRAGRADLPAMPAAS
jgi:lysophospholipase L1-like esterase